jgi:hypothetical protein
MNTHHYQKRPINVWVMNGPKHNLPLLSRYPNPDSEHTKVPVSIAPWSDSRKFSQVSSVVNQSFSANGLVAHCSSQWFAGGVACLAGVGFLIRGLGGCSKSRFAHHNVEASSHEVSAPEVTVLIERGFQAELGLAEFFGRPAAELH